MIAQREVVPAVEPLIVSGVTRAATANRAAVFISSVPNHVLSRQESYHCRATMAPPWPAAWRREAVF